MSDSIHTQTIATRRDELATHAVLTQASAWSAKTLR